MALRVFLLAARAFGTRFVCVHASCMRLCMRACAVHGVCLLCGQEHVGLDSDHTCEFMRVRTLTGVDTLTS